MPGQAAHVMQGFPIDGASIRRLELSGWVRHTNVVPGRSRQELPWLAVTLYDGHRKELGNWMIGPFQGDSPWRKVSKTIEVPPQAREGILRVGLFGAVGEISFDDVRFRVVGE
jgi:protein-L-isoaspartate(D-aspartate) O-methyltransferase